MITGKKLADFTSMFFPYDFELFQGWMKLIKQT